jgi:hypothetical protein
MKGMIAASLFRDTFANLYLQKYHSFHIGKNAVEDENKGMYFKDARWGYYWYQSPIEQQSLMIELLNENAVFTGMIQKLKNAVNDLCTWLFAE